MATTTSILTEASISPATTSTAVISIEVLVTSGNPIAGLALRPAGHQAARMRAQGRVQSHVRDQIPEHAQVKPRAPKRVPGHRHRPDGPRRHRTNRNDPVPVLAGRQNAHKPIVVHWAIIKVEKQPSPRAAGDGKVSPVAQVVQKARVALTVPATGPRALRGAVAPVDGAGDVEPISRATPTKWKPSGNILKDGNNERSKNSQSAPRYPATYQAAYPAMCPCANRLCDARSVRLVNVRPCR